MHLIYIDFFLFNFSLYNGHFSPVVDKSLEMDWNEYSLRLIIITVIILVRSGKESTKILHHTVQSSRRNQHSFKLIENCLGNFLFI